MNTDELKMILDLVATVSGDAKSVAIWYTAAKYGFSWVGFLIGATTVVLVVRIVAKAISMTNEWAGYGRAVSKAYGGDGDVFCYRSDQQAIQLAIKNSPQKDK